MGERAGIWLRVSTGGQDERDQLPDINRWIADHGYEAAATYQLRGKSAYKGEQDAKLDEVVADMAAGKIAVLVVWQSSRIERRGAYNAFDLARRVREAGGRIEYVKDAHLNAVNEMSDVALAMNATMDRLSSKAKSDAILKKHRALREKKSLIGRPAFGFMVVKDGDRKVLVPDPVLAGIIREAVRRFLNGASLAELCAWLDAEGVKPVTTDTWGRTSLVKLFRNPSLIGRRRNSAGRTVLVHEPILDPETWNQVQAELKRKGRRRGIGNAEPALLNQIATCASCGRPMSRFISSATRGNGAKYVRLYYRCRGTSKRPSECANLVLLDDLDGWVSEQASSDKRRITTIMTTPALSGAEEDIARIEQDIAELDLDSAGAPERFATLHAERARLRSQPAGQGRTDEAVASYSVGDLWGALDPAQQRRYLLDAGVRVVVAGRGDYRLDGDLATVAADAVRDAVGTIITARKSVFIQAPGIAKPSAITWRSSE